MQYLRICTKFVTILNLGKYKWIYLYIYFFFLDTKIFTMKSVCLALLVAFVLISAVHGQWYGSYGRGGWGDDYYGGYGLGSGYYGGGLIGGGLIGGGRFNRWSGGLGGGFLGRGLGGLRRRSYY
jgi:hypothetical protein